MLPTFLDKLSGFLDRRFIVAYWMPVFFFVVLMIGESAVLYGPTTTIQLWETGDATTKVLTGMGTLLVITVLAYMLKAFTFPLVRLYVGYWPEWIPWLKEWGVSRQKVIWNEIFEDINKRYYSYPRAEDRLQPTRLGNVLTAAYDYPLEVYGIRASIWWSRLTPLLPESFRSQTDDTLMPLFALLNLSAILILSALSSSTIAALLDERWWLCLLVLSGSLLLAYVCYVAAIQHAANYGEQIRAAFDLYRHELLKQMHIPLPDSAKKEYDLWYVSLHSWIYLYVLPWEPRDRPQAGGSASIAPPDFYYDTHQPESKPKVEKIIFFENESPILTVTRQEVTEE